MDKNRVWAEIDLDAIEQNIREMKRNMTDDCKMMAVLKSDGYGHGAVPIATDLEEMSEIYGYAMATVDEAIELRKAGLKKPILILGYTFPDRYGEVVSENIIPTIVSYEMAAAYDDEAKKQGKILPVHIKLDTGMGRLGFPMSRDAVDEIEKISKLSNLTIEGIFTHFARADEEDKDPTREQIELFEQMIAELEDRNITFPIRHASNSAGILEMPEANFDMTRAGISLYGLYPSEEIDASFPLKPALSLYSRIASIKEFEAGCPISYGGTFVTDEKTTVAVVPVGYGDGYARHLSGNGYVLVNGHKAPIIGRICMDQFMIDITDMENVTLGTLVTLVGKAGKHRITLEKLGDMSGRFNYEFACCLGNRIPRIYKKGGEVVATKEYY